METLALGKLSCIRKKRSKFERLKSELKKEILYYLKFDIIIDAVILLNKNVKSIIIKEWQKFDFLEKLKRLKELKYKMRNKPNEINMNSFSAMNKPILEYLLINIPEMYDVPFVNIKYLGSSLLFQASTIRNVKLKLKFSERNIPTAEYEYYPPRESSSSEGSSYGIKNIPKEENPETEKILVELNNCN